MDVNNENGMRISELAEVTSFQNEHGFPLLVRRAARGRSVVGVELLTKLYAQHQDWLDIQLRRYGAILFRKFEISDQNIFESTMSKFSLTFMDYVGGNSPRTRIGATVYTSTEYPPSYSIPMHNELSYAASWPRKLFFCCIIAPQEGGQTPLVDSRFLLRSLPGELVKDFRRKGVRYIRNLHGGTGFGRSWQETFETSDPARVDDYARIAGIDVQWRSDGSVSLSNACPATTVHPVTKEEVWFNQADQFHPSTITSQSIAGPEIYKTMMALYKGREDQLPQNATFGDGTEIPLEYLETIRRAMENQKVMFDWECGDLLMVDNLLVAHGRMPFVGPRRILVSMSAS